MSTGGLGGIFGFGERPIGSEANRRATEFVRAEAERMGYAVRRLAFTCPYWEKGPSSAERGGARAEVFAGPFSPAFDEALEVVAASSLDELKAQECAGKILFLRGEIAQEPLMPRDFPFYFPDAHKAVYEALDEKKPAAVVMATGAHPSCGLNPFPLFDDADFRIPAAFLGESAAAKLLEAAGPLRLKIDSRTTEQPGEQLVATKPAAGESQGKIVVCAHMDTAYGTPGALDNAAGVAVLLGAMERLKGFAGPHDLEFVPFNGEDSGMVKGQMAYLEALGEEFVRIRLVVNIDAPGCKGATTHVSAYNLDESRQKRLEEEIARHLRIGRGPEWVEGDHSIFAFQGIPALAVTSSNLREGVMRISHTPRDVEALVDPVLLEEAAEFIAGLVNRI
ncbi:MAG: Zn-dependent exopeptidase M28 [Opitutae bacterium]|nr:Zn-dependent exopeptidase M28 [Opitutae bacterium]